jgi:hypothetical protein
MKEIEVMEAQGLRTGCTKTVRIVPELSPNETKTPEKSRTEMNGDERKLIEKSGAY